MGRKEDGLYYGTCTFAIIGLVLAFTLPIYVYIRTKDKTENGKYQKENAMLAFIMSLFGAFCMWGLWVCVYMHQMNPIIVPILKYAE